jgi:hypothetical protein
VVTGNNLERATIVGGGLDDAQVPFDNFLVFGGGIRPNGSSEASDPV